MDVQVNWLAIVLATLSTMVVGSLWYMPKAFGNTWMQLVKLDRKKAQARGATPIVITVVVSLITAYVLAHISYLANQYFGNSFLQDALTTAFWMWLGFVAARFVTHDAFEDRPVKLTLINIAHELVTLLVMAAIIGLMKP